MDDRKTPANGSGLRPWLEWIVRNKGIDLDEVALSKLETLAGFMRRWNEKVNLTSITDDEGIAVKHMLDSLMLLKPLQDLEKSSRTTLPMRLADVGSGAGFPGLVLKIARPSLEICLMDALAKRVRYLEQAIETLQLENITAVHRRAEQAGREKGYRESFDVVTARAVASLPVLCEYCLPLVKTGGRFLAMKGKLGEELTQSQRAIKTLGGNVLGVQSFCLHGGEMQRSIVTICKTKTTPASYPRKAGTPEKKPL